jgi:NTE family protein
VLSGEVKVFSSARREITLDAVLASAAVPNLFRAVPIEGSLYWDGLFSQNPPVRELPDAQPDEIWVVQVNPPGRASEPRLIPTFSIAVTSCRETCPCRRSCSSSTRSMSS